MATETTLTTLMDKEVCTVLTGNEVSNLKATMERLLDDYDYRHNDVALTNIISEWCKEKGWIVEMFKKHPYYNGNYQIVIPANLKRPFDKEGINTFVKWCFREYRKALKVRRVMVGLFTYEDYESATRETERNYDKCPVQGTYKGYNCNYWDKEATRMKQRLEEARSKYRPRYINEDDNSWSSPTFSVSYEEYEKLNNFEMAIKKALSVRELGESNQLSKDHVDAINRYLDKFNTKALVGQKVTKFVGKLLKEVGLNKVVDIQISTWHDTNGVCHERARDIGYNYHFALLGDSVSPATYEREIVISCNPVDYWTMSFGYKWASCHTIDKENRRAVPDHQYSGCYSGGCSSYMLDNSSIVVYIRPTEAEIKSIGEENLPMEMQSKMKRCVFMLGEDKLIQSRLYPDGRDGGDEGLPAQVRAIVQKVVADCLETSNMWTLKKGSTETSAMIDDWYHQIHYPDYQHYNDVNVSFLRRINGDLNTKKIKVGASEIICPGCGTRHKNEENIACDRCADRYEYYCDRCGDGINEYDEFIRTSNGRYYCCQECANRDNYYYVEDDDDYYHIDYIMADCYSGEYYSDNADGVSTYEGNWYYNEDNCYNDGNRWCEDIDDYSMNWVEASNGYYYHDESELIKIGSVYYATEEDAIDAGYVENEDGEWVAA